MVDVDDVFSVFLAVGGKDGEVGEEIGEEIRGVDGTPCLRVESEGKI